MLIVATVAQGAESFLGTPISVIDGDTFRIKTETENVKIRLCGVDSRGQPGYRPATDALANLIRGKQVHCLQVGSGTPCDGQSRPTSRDRTVAQCFIGDLDVAAEMVRLRQACDWPYFSGGHYRIDAATCIKEGH